MTANLTSKEWFDDLWLFEQRGGAHNQKTHGRGRGGLTIGSKIQGERTGTNSELADALGAAAPALPQTQRDAVARYAGTPRSFATNKALRDRSPLSGADKRDVALLGGAMKPLGDVAHGQKVYRGSKELDAGKLSTGDVLSSNAFTSTTTDSAHASRSTFSNDAILEITLDKTTRGRYNADPAYRIERESELILARGTQLEITGARRMDRAGGGEVTVIEARALPPVMAPVVETGG